MSDFESAIPTILRHEGGFSNDPQDAGGATNYGVSLRWLKSQGLLEDLEQQDRTQDEIVVIKSMTQEQAAALYKLYWWNPYNYGAIDSQLVATKIFDTAVNLGAPRAHRIVQACLGFPQEMRDGILGSKSMAEINAAGAAPLVVQIQNMQAAFYMQLVATNPARQKFLQGWLNRAYDRS
jgi:lysozyme family protein